MNKKELREVIEKVMFLHPEFDYEHEKCWEREVQLATEDMPGTLDFIKNECTDEEFFYLAGVFDDIARESQNWEFIDTIKKRTEAVTAESYAKNSFKTDLLKKITSVDEYKESIKIDIDFAEYNMLDG